MEQKGKFKLSGRAIFMLALLILLPLIIAGVYVVQRTSSQASASCPPTNIKIQRSSASEARISFDTTCSVKANVNCAIARGGVKFFCGGDETATTSHIISTDEVTLSTNTGYYAFIDTGTSTPMLGYIPANPTDKTYGLNVNSLDEDTMGTTADDLGFDPALDINQDGVVNIMDKMEFYPDAK